MSDELIEVFWRRAMTQARINPFEVVTGPDKESALTPPTWTMPDRDIETILADGTTVLTSPVTAHDSLPKPGALSILLWENEHPAALLRTTEVSIHDVEDIDGWDEKPSDWTEVRNTVPDGTQVVVERFRVLVKHA